MSFFDLPRTPGIHCRLRRGHDLSRSRDGGSFTLRRPGGESEPFVSYEEAFAAALDRLSAGAHASELRNLALGAGGPARAAAFMMLLRRLAAAGLVEFPLLDEAGERAVLLPQIATFEPALAEEPAPDISLDRFAFIRRDDRGWLLESPLVGARLSFSDSAALDSPVVRRALAAAGFLEQRDDDPRHREALDLWEFHDLAFYRHHRGGWHQDPMGGIYPHLGRIESPPAIRSPWPGTRITLPVAVDRPSAALADVLERRASIRAYDQRHPITLNDVGALFDRAVRIRGDLVVSGTFGGGPVRTGAPRRPYPTGGGCGELEIYLAIDRAADIETGLYHYDAADHALVRLCDRTPAVAALLAEARDSAGGIDETQALVIVAARFARVMWKYSAIAYALILRDTGVLYQTLYLAATDLGLAPCALGNGNAAAFAEATGLDPLIEGSVGEFLLGGRPTGPAMAAAEQRAGRDA